MCEIIPSRPNKMNESEIQVLVYFFFYCCSGTNLIDSIVSKALVNQENTYFDDPFESEDNIDDDRCCALGSQAGGNQNSKQAFILDLSFMLRIHKLFCYEMKSLGKYEHVF